MSERDTDSPHPSPADRSHEETRELLSEYAAAMALGQAPQRRYPSVAAHLERCPLCREELDALLELAIPAYTGQVVPADDRPTFDLSFLRPPAAPVEAQPSWSIDGMRRLVIRFSEALLESMRQQPLAQAARGEALYRHKPELPDGLSVTIDVFAGDDAPEIGSVQVLIDLPSRDPFDQSGTHVVLRMGERAWEGATGETGSVTFSPVPLGRLPQLNLEIALPDENDPHN